MIYTVQELYGAWQLHRGERLVAVVYREADARAILDRMNEIGVCSYCGQIETKDRLSNSNPSAVSDDGFVCDDCREKARKE